MKLLVATITAVLALAGCSREGAGAHGEKAKPAWAYERQFNQGAPVSLALRLDRTDIALSDKVALEEELHVEEGFEADFPEYLPEDFEGFSVVEIQSSRKEGEAAADSPPAKPGSSKDAPSPDPPSSDALSTEAVPAAAAAAQHIAVRRKRLTLEPDRSGSLAVAPLAVYFHRSGEKAEQSFLTEEVPVTVTGVGSVKDLKLEPLRGIYEAPPDARASSWPLYTAAVGTAILAAGATFFFLRRGQLKPPPPVPPHELAYEALRRLVALALVEKGEIELFFVHLSGILREYIERRFHVRAPESTTEEFLELASKNEALTTHGIRLGQFLRLCDEVKFARFEPDEAAIQGAFDVVKQFLAETTPVEARAA